MHRTKLFSLAFFAILFSVTIQSAQLPAPLNVVLPSPETHLPVVDSRVKFYDHEIYLKNPYNFSYRDQGSGPTITELLQAHSSLVFFLGHTGINSICRPAATLQRPTSFTQIGFFAIQENPLNHITVIPFGKHENMFYFAKVCELLNVQGSPLNPASHLNSVLDLVLPVKLIPKIPRLVDLAVQSLIAPIASKDAHIDTTDLLHPVSVEIQTDNPQFVSIESQTPASWIFAQHAADQATNPRESSASSIVHVAMEPAVNTHNSPQSDPSSTKKKKDRRKKQSQEAAASAGPDDSVQAAPNEDEFTRVRHGARSTSDLLDRAFNLEALDQQKDDNEADTPTPIAQSNTTTSAASKRESIQSSSKQPVNVAPNVREESAQKKATSDDALLTQAQLENDLARQSLLYPLFLSATHLMRAINAPGYFHTLQDNTELLCVTDGLKSQPQLYTVDLKHTDVTQSYKHYLTYVLGYLLTTGKINKPFIEKNFKKFLGDDCTEVFRISKKFPPSSPTPTPSPITPPSAQVTPQLREALKTKLLTKATEYPIKSILRVLHECRDLITVEDLPALLEHVPAPEGDTTYERLLRQELKNIIEKTYREYYKSAPCAATLQPLYNWCSQKNGNANTLVTHLESILLLGNILRHDEAISLPIAFNHLSMHFKEHPRAELTHSQELEQYLFDTFHIIAQGTSLAPDTKALKTIVKRFTNADAIDKLETIWNNTCTLFSQHLPIETARPFLKSCAQTLHEQLVTKKENQQAQQLCVVLKLACCKEEKQRTTLKALENYLIELFKDHLAPYSVKNRILLDTIHQVNLLSTLPENEQEYFVVTLQRAIAQHENDFYTANPLSCEENNRLFNPDKYSPFILYAIYLSNRRSPWLRGYSKECNFSYGRFITSSDYRQNTNTEICRTLKECVTEVQEHHHWSVGYGLFETLAYLNRYRPALSFPEGSSHKNIQETVATIQGLFRILPPRLQTLLFLSNTTLWKKYLNL